MKRFNLYFGASVSAWLLAGMVIVAEIFAPFKTFLASMFSHHWIGKGVIVTLVFIASGLFFRERKSSESVAWYSTLGSLVVIFVFFILEYLLK